MISVPWFKGCSGRRGLFLGWNGSVVPGFLLEVAVAARLTHILDAIRLCWISSERLSCSFKTLVRDASSEVCNARVLRFWWTRMRVLSLASPFAFRVSAAVRESQRSSSSVNATTALLIFQGRAMNRHSQTNFPTLSCAHAALNVVGDFFPTVKNLSTHGTFQNFVCFYAKP